MEHLEERQQRQYALEEGVHQVDCHLIGDWIVSSVNGKKKYSISDIRADYQLQFFPQNLAVRLVDLPQVIVKAVLDNKEMRLEQDEGLIRVLGESSDGA